MKQNVKVFLIALVLGMIVAFLVCYKYDNTIITNALETKVTYFSIGSYNNLEDATNKKNSYANSIIYNDNGLYQVVIGVYNDKDVISLMESYFLDNNYNIRKKEIKFNNEFIKAINNYELLIKSSDKNYYESINLSILKLFNEYINR